MVDDVIHHSLLRRDVGPHHQRHRPPHSDSPTCALNFGIGWTLAWTRLA
jgi:hypothetical protein